MNQNTNTSPSPRVAVGVDASQNALHAALWAASEAEDRGATLILAHALDLATPTAHDTPRRRAEGEHLLSRVEGEIRMRHPGLRVDGELSELSPIRALMTLSLDVDLLITGTRGHGGFTGMLLGSVSNRLAAHAHCPLVVVGAEHAAAVRPEIVLGLEPEEDPAPIDFAFRTAARLGLGIRAVRAFEPLPAYNGYLIEGIEDGRRAAVLGMESLLKAGRGEYPDVPVTLETRQDVPVPTLARAARGARLLVVGSPHSHELLGFGAGHIVQSLLAHAETPVVVVPTR